MAQPPNTPSFTWLRAFEAAARLGSLKDAAGGTVLEPAGQDGVCASVVSRFRANEVIVPRRVRTGVE
jgi:hypothetical protein